MPQDVAAINSEAGHAVFLGDVAQRVVCSPDIAQMLSDSPVPEWPRSELRPPVSGGYAGPTKEKQEVAVKEEKVFLPVKKERASS